MKRTVRFFLLAAVAAVLAALMFTTAYAVPAAPDSGLTGAEAACPSRVGKLVTLDDVPVRPGKAFAAPSLESPSKNIPLVVIVIGFQNVPYNDAYDWGATMFSGEKSLQAYYSDMSFGKFTFAPVRETSAFGVDGNTNAGDAPDDGVVHIALDVDHQDWSSLSATDLIRRERLKSMGKAFAAAIEKAGDYVDFAAYDADENGEITTDELAVAIVVAGYEASADELGERVSNGLQNYLWSHSSSISDMAEGVRADIPVPTPGGVAVDSYIAVAETLDDAQEPIGVVAHELGHYLGLPDLYDTTYAPLAEWGKYNVLYASLMAGGSWGVDPDGGYMPCSLDAWSRYVLGWYEPVVVAQSGVYSVAAQTYAANDGFSAVMIRTGRSNEYYLLENRQFVKWDVGMPLAYDNPNCRGGVIMWHIDDDVYDKYNELNLLNASYHRPGVMPIFPEFRRGTFTLTGLGEIYNGNPFFDKTMLAGDFAVSSAAVELPLYGRGTLADARSARVNAGIAVQFLSDADAEMEVDINIDHVEIEETEPCKYCGGTHTGLFGKIVAFFHNIMYAFRRLFGA